MESIFLNNLSWLMPTIVFIGFAIWVFGAFHSFKLISGIKEAMGTAHYTLPNRWPGYDNPETREIVNKSTLLKHHKNKRAFWLKAFFIYVLLVITPVMASAFYLNYAK